MIKVYLQTPYKVYSINDVKRMKKNNSREYLNRAENLLQIHTEYRNNGHVSGGYNLQN